MTTAAPTEVAVLGGTGPFGRGLAWRLALGGASVRIGSRDAARAEEVAVQIRERAGASGVKVSGMTNREAAESSEVVFLAVPFAAQEALLEEVARELAEKLVICCAVIWPPGSRPETSAGEEAKRMLERTMKTPVRMAAAFQTVAAGALWNEQGSDAPDELPDVLVFADNEEDRNAAAEVAVRTGLHAVPVGRLERSRIAEAALTLLLDINRNQPDGAKRHAGLRISGTDR